jgi:hypothetical protein
MGAEIEKKAWLTRRTDLKTPLLTEEQSQRADICVLLVSDILVRHWVGRNVVHHCQRAGGRAVVPVQVLESCSTSEAKPSGECRQDGLGDDIGARNSVLEDLDVSAVLDVAGDVRCISLDLITGYLWI